MLNPLVPLSDHQRNLDLCKFVWLYINKNITNVKLHNLKQTDQRKKSKSIPKFRKSPEWVDFGTGLNTIVEETLTSGKYISLFLISILIIYIYEI